MSLDMRRFGVTVETPDSEESMAVGLSVPLGRDGAALVANTAAYEAPTPDEPGCQLLEAACSPVAAVVTGRGVDPAPIAGRRLAGSAELPELASSLAFRFPAGSALLPLAVVVPLFVVDTTGTFLLPAVAADTVGVFFFLVVVTILLWRVDRALIKASSSCFSIALQQGRISVESVVFTAAATVCFVHSNSSSPVTICCPLFDSN